MAGLHRPTESDLPKRELDLLLALAPAHRFGLVYRVSSRSSIDFAQGVRGGGLNARVVVVEQLR